MKRNCAACHVLAKQCQPHSLQRHWKNDTRAETAKIEKGPRVDKQKSPLQGKKCHVTQNANASNACPKTKMTTSPSVTTAIREAI